MDARHSLVQSVMIRRRCVQIVEVPKSRPVLVKAAQPDMQEPDRALQILVGQLPRLFPTATPAWITEAAFALGEVKQGLLAPCLYWDDEKQRAFIESAKRRGDVVQEQVYNNITLYVLSQGQQGYVKMENKKATRNSLQNLWDKFSYVLVARVERQPAQLLTLATCPHATDMGSVELEDGARLALVLHQPLNFMGQLVDTINKNVEKGDELEGFKNNILFEQENVAAAWALKMMEKEPGAQIFCIKKLSQKRDNGVVIAVELDGAACSDMSCNIVERKQEFRHKDVLGLITKIKALKILIDDKAPNTDLLQGRELRVFMMAGSWPASDTDQQAAVRELMLQHDIQPVMPDGSGYHISWGCSLETPDQAKRVPYEVGNFMVVLEPTSCS